jgi:hypothetical protein
MNLKSEPGYPERLILVATWTKAVLQMIVAAYAVGWLVWSFFLSNRIHNCVAASAQASGAREQFCYFIPPANVAFQIIASALAAATVIELAFTLFTPGPDEALDPVLLAIAAALLFQLGKVDQFHWQDGLAVVLYGIALAALFMVRVFIAPDEERPPRLWWWLPRQSPHAEMTVPTQRH